MRRWCTLGPGGNPLPPGPSLAIIGHRRHASENPGVWGGAPGQAMPSFIVTAVPSNNVSALNFVLKRRAYRFVVGFPRFCGHPV